MNDFDWLYVFMFVAGFWLRGLFNKLKTKKTTESNTIALLKTLRKILEKLEDIEQRLP